MTDFSKLAEGIDDLIERSNGLDAEDFAAKALPLLFEASEGLAACDRERQAAVAERDEYGRDQYAQGREDAEALAQRYREALEQYADPTHWGVQRDDFKHPSVVWIGPGATETPVPNPMLLARDALKETPENA